MTPERGESMAPHTSLRVGGPADYFTQARSCVELVEALRWARAEGVPVRVIGGGSNLLVADAGVDGLVIKAVGASFEVIGDSAVRADAGVNLANMARRLAKPRRRAEPGTRSTLRSKSSVSLSRRRAVTR